MRKKFDRKNIWKIAAIAIIGMFLLMCVPTAAQTWGSDHSSTTSYRIIIDSNNNASDEVFAVWHDGTGVNGSELFRVQEDGHVGVGTSNPGSMLEVNGPIEIDDMRFIQGERHLPSGSAQHYWEMFNASFSGDYDECEIWGNILCRRGSYAHAAYMPFVLTIKRQENEYDEPTIQFKYWKSGALSGARLLVKRTSRAGVTPKVVSLWVYTPTSYATLNWEYHYNDNYWNIFQNPRDNGTNEPYPELPGPNYYGNEWHVIDGGRFSIGVASPLEQLDVNGAIRIGTTTNTNAGTIRWTGTDFQGYNGSSWVSLTDSGIGGSGTPNRIPKFQTATTLMDSIMYESAGSIGISAPLPVTTLDVNGGLATNTVTVTAPVYNVPAPNSDFTIIVDTVFAPPPGVTINLPSANLVDGQILVIKKVDSLPGGWPVSIVPAPGEAIDGSFIGFTLSVNYNSIMIQADTTHSFPQWFII
jgi:hypothetical protein